MPVTLPLRFPRCLILITITLHFSALLVLYFTQLSRLPLILLILVVLFSLCIVLFRIFGHLGGMTLDALKYADGQIDCYGNGRIVFAGALRPDSVVTPLFILLALQNDSTKKRRHLFLCHSQFLKDDFRQLAVRLRMS